MNFIKTLMNYNQIYTYLMKLKLNLRIGPNRIIKKTFMVTNISNFTMSVKKF